MAILEEKIDWKWLQIMEGVKQSEQVHQLGESPELII